MNKRVIKSTLTRKHNHFLKSIKDERVRNLIHNNSFITGGSIASMLLNETINDFDYYFTNRETTLAVAEYYVGLFKQEHQMEDAIEILEEDDRIKISIRSKGVAGELDTLSEEQQVGEALEEEPPQKAAGGYQPIYLSSNAVSLSNKVQLILRFYGSPDEIHENYDFVHCTNYWIPSSNKLVLKPEALESLLTKQLTYVGSKYPLCSVIRTRKFIKRGWHINAGQYLKMCFQVSELDLTDIAVLEDQLTGVDSDYFNQVIAQCKEPQEKDSTFTISSTYLAEVVDKLF